MVHSGSYSSSARFVVHDFFLGNPSNKAPAHGKIQEFWCALARALHRQLHPQSFVQWTNTAVVIKRRSTHNPSHRRSKYGHMFLLFQEQRHPSKNPSVLGLICWHGYFHQQAFAVQGEVQRRVDGLVNLREARYYAAQ